MVQLWQNNVEEARKGHKMDGSGKFPMAPSVWGATRKFLIGDDSRTLEVEVEKDQVAIWRQPYRIFLLLAFILTRFLGIKKLMVQKEHEARRFYFVFLWFHCHQAQDDCSLHAAVVVHFANSQSCMRRKSFQRSAHSFTHLSFPWVLNVFIVLHLDNTFAVRESSPRSFEGFVNIAHNLTGLTGTYRLD
jgi:hypothetical protein